MKMLQFAPMEIKTFNAPEKDIEVAMSKIAQIIRAAMISAAGVMGQEGVIILTMLAVVNMMLIGVLPASFLTHR
jgi:hypothetical protein